VAGAGTLGDSYESGLVVHVDHLRGLDTLRVIDFSQAPEMPPLGRALDLLGDGSLWAIATPGHSAGHVTYLVNAETGPVLLVGDASHTAWGFAHDVAPGKVVDAAAARASLARLRAFTTQFPQVRVVYGHEMP
jgi:glyoxylase-like metal-dependent hydrolase (beta-lactamase superfamily II)